MLATVNSEMENSMTSLLIRGVKAIESFKTILKRDNLRKLQLLRFADKLSQSVDLAIS